MNAPLHLWLIPLLPFAGFLINGLFGRRMPKFLVTTVALLAPLGAFLAVLFSVDRVYNIAFAGNGPVRFDNFPIVEALPFSWINIGTLHIDFTFVLDQLSLLMLLVVTGVGFLIHIYSVGYMADDKGYARYFSYLNLFLFFMTVLVLAGNALVMFIGWEGVGLASYLLIGFWFTKDAAANAGKKAFIVNRIGDFGFLIAMFMLLANFGTLTFSEIAAKLAANPAWTGGVLTCIALCLMLGAAGKSAQLPLYVWLPDAMEGPTPVSALIHAATMVTAGVYLLARMHFLFDRSPFALAVIAIIGAATALFAATIALVQTDIKRVLAYSTISQLGYMFLGCGVAAYSAAIFHLMTHAFFKALLFLAAGSAIAGIPPLAGFFSKDAILFAAFQQGTLGKALYFVGLITAALTAFYMFRLWYLTFLGESRAQEHHQHHPTPVSMLAPLVILALLSIVGGWMGIERFATYLAPATGPIANEAGRSQLELYFSIIAVAVAAAGWFIAHNFYKQKPSRPAELAAALPGAYNVLVHKYYVDEFYGAVIVKPLLAFSTYALGWVVDNAILGGLAWLLGGIATFSGALLQRWQSGNLRSYAAWLAAGAAVLLLFLFAPTILGTYGISIAWKGW